MNTNIKFSITGQRIELTEPVMLVAGTVHIYTAAFVFDSAWEGQTKTAVFRSGDVEREQLLTDDACTVPWEVLLPGAYLKVGVYGTRDGSRLPTIWTERTQYINAGAGPTDEAAEPSPTMVEQLLTKVGNLDALKTEDKSSVVAAVNEIWESGGGGTGGGTTDHSKLTNRGAADQHPMSAITGLVNALAGKQPTGNYLTEEQDPTVPEWAKQPQKPAYTAQEVGALPDTTHIPTALSEMTDDATHRVVTDAEKAEWNGKSNFSGSYNDLTEKPIIPEQYTLPIATANVIGGVKPSAKTDAMTQEVGVDDAGGLWAAPGGGGDQYKLIAYHETTDDDVTGTWIAWTYDTYDNGAPLKIHDILVAIENYKGSGYFYAKVFSGSSWNWAQVWPSAGKSARMETVLTDDLTFTIKSIIINDNVPAFTSDPSKLNGPIDKIEIGCSAAVTGAGMKFYVYGR